MKKTVVEQLIEVVNNRSLNSIKTIFRKEDFDFWLKKQEDYIKEAYAQGRFDEETRFPFATDEDDYFNKKFKQSLEKLVNPNNQEVMFHEERQEYFHEDFIDGKKVTIWLGKNYTPKETSKQSTKDRIMSETSEETKQKARDYGNSLIKQDRTCTHNCSAVCGECQILEPKPLLSVDWLLRYIEGLAKKGYTFSPSSNKEIVEHVKQMEKDNMINFLKSVFQQDGFDYEKAYNNFLKQQI